jgi:hypothetical protein
VSAPLPTRSVQLAPVAEERLGDTAYRLREAGRSILLLDGDRELIALVPAGEFRRLQRLDTARRRDEAQGRRQAGRG